MLLKRLSDSILHFPSISEVSDNSNRLYNLDGVLYFNGVELGSGDVENVWVNSNDFATYTTVTANLYDTWVTLNTSIDLLNGNSNVSVEDLVVGLEGANTNIDTVQANLTTDVANLYNTWSSVNTNLDTIQANLTLDNASLTANTYNTYTTLNTAIDTVQANLTLDNASLTANTYNTYTTLNTAIDIVQANLTLDNASLTANTYNTYTTLNTAIDTVQANLTLDNASLTANTYNTWKTVNTAIDTIQANISLNVISDAITPSSDDAGYVGNASRTWASGHFTEFEIDSSLQVGGSVTIEGNLTVTGNTVTVNASELAIEDNMIYLNANNAVTNPDLGIAGNYNDGTYAHAGFFRDASDGRWKVYEGYLPEPDASPYIDTSNSSFSLAAFQAEDIFAAAVEINEVDILANLYNTYDILTANVYNTYIAIVGSDGVTTSQVVANLYNTWVSVNTNLDIIQANLTLDNASLTANTYNTYTTLNTAIDTVQANLSLDNASLTANTYNTYTTLNAAIDTVQANLSLDNASITANTYNTYTTLNAAIDTVQANLTLDNASLTANTYNTYTTLNTAIDTVQANLTTGTANLYNTWKTVNTAIDTVNANVAFDNPDLVLPSANLTGVVGNVAKTYSSGHFNNLTVLNDMYLAGATVRFPGSGSIYWGPDINVIQKWDTVDNSVEFNLSLTEARFKVSGWFGTDADLFKIEKNSAYFANTVTMSSDAHVSGSLYADKILYSNMYSNEVDLPSATDYHGMFAHVHATGAGYFSHNGNWIKLVDNTTPTIAASTALVAGATTNPSTSTLHVTGNAYISSDILIGGTLTETSTIKIKENIVPLNNQLDKLMLLRPVEYDKINSRSHEYGLIAEEVANVLPEAVSSGNSAIQYTRLIPTLIKAVQELKQEVQELRNGST